MSGAVVGDLIIVEICRKFSWDYHTYIRQPVWFINLIIEMMKIEATKAKAAEQDLKHKR